MAAARDQSSRSAKAAVEIGRFLRGCVVAAAAFVSFMGVGLGLRYYFGVGEVAAAMIAVLCTTPISYLGHVFFTFRISLTDWTYVPRFFAMGVIGFAVSWAVMSIGVQRLGMPYALGLLMTTLVIPLLNYLALRLYVFAKGLSAHGG